MVKALASSVAVDPIAAGRAALGEGDPARAALHFHAAAAGQPGDYECRYWLYSALAAAGEAATATLVLEEARNLHAHAVLQAAGVDMDRYRNDRAYCAQAGLQRYAQSRECAPIGTTNSEIERRQHATECRMKPTFASRATGGTLGRSREHTPDHARRAHASGDALAQLNA